MTTDLLHRRLGWLALLLCLAPALAAIAFVPGFVTQDSPAHLYNAHVLLESLRPGSPLHSVYAVKWHPVPNWAGHLSLVGLMAMGIPPRAADRLLMAATLAGFAAALFWLRLRVSGTRDLVAAVPLCALLAMSLPWLSGFTSFLLGACLFPIILGVWWTGRHRMTGPRAAAIAALLIVGYFAHAVSLGVTALGLLVLAAAEPAPGRSRRWAWTLATLLPLVPLGWAYRSTMRGVGEIDLTWITLKDPLSIASWRAQIGWVDPLTLGSRFIAPFVEPARPAFLALTPVLWAGSGLVAQVVATILARRGDSRRGRRGWFALALLLMLGGLVGPDTIGPKHGSYLTQRILLLGLAALVPVLDIGISRSLGTLGVACVAIALVLQSAFVWDYALRSDRVTSALLEAAPHVGRNQRIGTLLLAPRQRYRPNPLLHADTLLGLGTGNIIWNNYESASYLFPVQIRQGVGHPDPLAFQRASFGDDPAGAERRAADWEALLREHHPEIDVLVIWGDDPVGQLDATTRRWFEPAAREGKIRIWRNRDHRAAG